jgi:hypothetical protein
MKIEQQKHAKGLTFFHPVHDHHRNNDRTLFVKEEEGSIF